MLSSLIVIWSGRGLPYLSFCTVGLLMSLPLIAIINASTCLSDAQVEAVLPALQKQVSADFRAYWELDCTLAFLSKDQPLAEGWWQIAVVDNPDQAGALGNHELPGQGSPFGKN